MRMVAQRQRRLPRCLFRTVQQRRVIDQAFENAGLVAHLMEVAEPAADIGVGNLPDQAEHWRVHGVSRQ